MSDLKLSVTIELQGSVMMTPQECGENPENYNGHTTVLNVKHYDKKTKKSFYRKEVVKYQTRKCIPAYQSINMSQESYDYMTSTACPEWFMPKGGLKIWKNLSKKQRLEEHLTRTCEALNGKSYTYIVYDD